MNVKLLVWVNGIMGVVLGAGGSITAYASAVGSAAHAPGVVTVVGLVLAGAGVLQTISAGVLHVFDPQAKVAALAAASPH